MKELISLDGNGNLVRFIHGNDGDIHISFCLPDKKIYFESVRVGVGNSGGQEVPIYVKQALHAVCEAMERWDHEEVEEPAKATGIEEKKLPEGLEEAEDAHIRRVANAVRHRGWDLETQDIAEAFKAGAEWMKSKMLEDAVEGEVEIWKPVVGYNGYEVSNRGRVISRKQSKDGIILIQQTNQTGYKYVTLRDENYNAHSGLVHRLVAEAFIPNPDGKKTVNHRNENKADNRVSNLEWATHREQANYGSRKRPDINNSMYDENGHLSRLFIQKRLYLRKLGYLLDDKNLIAYWTPETRRSKKHENEPLFYTYKKYNGEQFDFFDYTPRPRVKIERVDTDGNIVSYDSISEAARENCVSVSLIKRRLAGRYGDESHINIKCSEYVFRVKED